MEDAIKMRVGGQGAIVTGEGLEGGKQRLPLRVFFLVCCIKDLIHGMKIYWNFIIIFMGYDFTATSGDQPPDGAV